MLGNRCTSPVPTLQRAFSSEGHRPTGKWLYVKRIMPLQRECQPRLPRGIIKLNVCKKETNKQKKLPKMLTLNTVISSVVFKPAEHFQVSIQDLTGLKMAFLYLHT